MNIEEIEPEPLACPACGWDLEWMDCGLCEDGWVDVYEDDPLWYDEGDMERCDQCDGLGGWWWCPNNEQHEKVTE